MVTLIVLAFLVLALLAYLVGIYNGLVRVGASVKLAWSNIECCSFNATMNCPSWWKYAANTWSMSAIPWSV
jgi:hypothetical protein